MLNISQIRERIKELDSKHYGFFNAANSNTLSFIDIHDDGRITFKSGIVIDIKVWQDIKNSLNIADEESEDTVMKNPQETSNIFHSIMKASVKPNKIISSGFDSPKCPECDLHGKFLPPPRESGKIVYNAYVCPNGHKFEIPMPVK